MKNDKISPNSNNKKRTKLVKESLINEDYHSPSNTCINDFVLRMAGISNNDIKYIHEIYDDVANRMGDQGSCVLGNGLYINGKLAITSYSQGSLGLEKIQKIIKDFLQKNYPELKVNYEWGNMD